MDYQTILANNLQRMKKKHKKTRTGCITCKQRRVKCGEEKPRCERCKALNKHCYYRVPLLISSTTQQATSHNYDVELYNPLLELAQSPIERTQETVRLQQFCMSTSLAVFKNLGQPFQRFWTSAVPKLSISEACVAHIMVALAARQRASFYVSETAERSHLRKIYAKHHSDALHLLVDPASQQRPEIILLCCLMFISMENVEDTVANKFLHLTSGLKVLREYKEKWAISSDRRTQSVDDLIQQTLEPMFARLEAAVSPTIYPGMNERSSHTLIWELPEIPASFEDLASARGIFWEIAQWAFSQGNHQITSNPHSKEFLDTLDLCHKWKKVFDKYSADHPDQARQYSSSVIALSTNYQLLVLLIQFTTMPNERLWNTTAHNQTLETILKNVQAIQGKGLTQIPSRRTLMNILPRMMPALFTVAVISRSRTMQTEALQLIKGVHEEYHSDQCFAAVIAEGLMNLEDHLKSQQPWQLNMNESIVRPRRAELIAGMPGKIVLTYVRPYARTTVVDDPILGHVGHGQREETIELSWRSESVPPSKTIWLWPVIEFLRLIGSSGLVGANTGHCLCKTYGALFSLMR